MPRHIPNPQGFNKPPGELVLHILRYVLEDTDISSQTIKQLIKSSMFLARLNWKIKNSTDRIIGLHFHEFLQPSNCGVHDNLAPFHVHSMGHGRHRTLTRGRLPNLRCVSLDLRAQEPHTQSSLRLWKTKHAPRWIQTSAILSRIGAVSRGIEELNVRLSPQQDLVDLVQDVINTNKSLHTIRIEVDSAVISRTAGDQQIRFFDIVRDVDEFTLACAKFNAVTPTLPWLLHLLRHMSAIRFFDFAVSWRESNHIALPEDAAAVPVVHLRTLEKLSIQIPEVDGHLLRAMKAPAMYKIRIKSEVHINAWPECDGDQFPNIFIANISCPGPSAYRLRALGVPYKSYSQNLSTVHNWDNEHFGSFLAYVRPYSFRRFAPGPPPHPWAPPPPLSDNMSELTELSDSEGLWPDSTPVPVVANSAPPNEDEMPDVTIISPHTIQDVVGSTSIPAMDVDGSNPPPTASTPTPGTASSSFAEVITHLAGQSISSHGPGLNPPDEAAISDPPAAGSTAPPVATASSSFEQLVHHVPGQPSSSYGGSGNDHTSSTSPPLKRRRCAPS
ncbi:hypothetical protein CF319_g4769 [Tilletia indica]|nr:hypothetical protein CF319_g4769 [Tilletia indica]